MQGFPGWTFEYVEEQLTLPRVLAIFRVWGRKPPVHWCVRAFVAAPQGDAPSSPAGASSQVDGAGLFEALGGAVLDG